MFGAIALAFTNTKSDMTTRGVPYITIRESNRQGGFYFMSLHSGKEIHSFNWKEFPIYDDIIIRVKELVLSQNQPVFKKKTPIFEWSPGVTIKDNNQLIDYNSDSDSSYNRNESDNESISSSNSDTYYEDDNDVDEDLDYIIFTDDDDMNLEHSSDERKTHSFNNDDVDQDNAKMIVQDTDSVYLPSDIPNIDSLFSNDYTASGAITNNDAT